MVGESEDLVELVIAEEADIVFILEKITLVLANLKNMREQLAVGNKLGRRAAETLLILARRNFSPIKEKEMALVYLAADVDRIMKRSRGSSSGKTAQLFHAEERKFLRDSKNLRNYLRAVERRIERIKISDPSYSIGGTIVRVERIIALLLKMREVLALEAAATRRVAA